MPDLKISQLTDGVAPAAADELPVARSGANRKLTVAQLRATDITWADLLTAIGGSTLVPLAWYHVTTAPDGSTSIDEAWVQAKDANEIFPDGMCLINAANITNRLAEIKFFMAGGVGGKIAGVYDGLKNVVEGYAVTSGGTSSTANIDAWLDILTAINQSVKVYGSVLNGGASGNIADYSELFGATAQLAGASSFEGICIKGSFNLDNASNANRVYILDGGLVLDNGAIFASGLIGTGKTVSMLAGETAVGWSTEGNIKLTEYAANPTGDTATVDNSDGVVYIVDGSTDVTINMPAGLMAGQQMMIYFKQGSAAITWGGAATDATTFGATAVAGQKIMAFWDANATTWR